MLPYATMCAAGLVAAWLLLRTRDADRPRIPHYLALFLSMGVACIGGYALLLHAVFSVTGRHRDAPLLWGSVVLIPALFVASICLKDKAWRQAAGIAGSFLLGTILLTVGIFTLIFLAVRGPQPPSLSKLQSKFPQRRSRLERIAAAQSAVPSIGPPKSMGEIEREKQRAAQSSALMQRILHPFSYDDAPPLEILHENGAILFVYGRQNGPLIGGGLGPTWGYLYCPDSSGGNPASICQYAVIHSGADLGSPSFLSLRLDQHWFAYSRGPSQ